MKLPLQLVIIFLGHQSPPAWGQNIDSLDEIFGSGLDDKLMRMVKGKHLASSFEDLEILHDKEKKFIGKLAKLPTNPDIKSYLDSSLPGLTGDHNYYLYHPINSFHLLKRATHLAPKIIKDHPELKEILEPPDKMDFRMGAMLGILNLQHYHGLSSDDLMGGKFFDTIDFQVRLQIHHDLFQDLSRIWPRELTTDPATI